MPKKINKCFYQNLTFEKFLSAHNRARKQKTYKKELIEYEINLENNLVNLINNIKNKKYHLGKYHEFKIYEPKERIIKALPYQDRIVHQWYVEEFIKPYFIPRLLNTTYACIEGRGTHAAAQQVQKYLRICKRNWGSFWILKCDIKKYFYSINPHILLNILSRHIRDKDLFDFTKLIIFESRGKNENLGIPIRKLY